jgi:hypothetical protein
MKIGFEVNMHVFGIGGVMIFQGFKFGIIK